MQISFPKRRWHFFEPIEYLLTVEEKMKMFDMSQEAKESFEKTDKFKLAKNAKHKNKTHI